MQRNEAKEGIRKRNNVERRKGKKLWECGGEAIDDIKKWRLY